MLYGKLRPYLNKVCRPEFDGICSTDILVFPQSEHLESRYLLYFLSRRQTVEFANHHSSGIQLPRIGFDKLAELEFPLPPLTEQRRIVAKLEEVLAQVNAARERLERVPAILKRFRQAVLAAAFSGRLTEGWREENPDVESAEQLRAKLRASNHRTPSVPAPQEGEDDLPRIPDSWVWTSIGECFRVAIGSTPSRKEPSYWNGEIPWVSSGEVAFCRIRETRERITDAGLRNSSTQINPAGSVLLGMIGEGKTRGQAAILEIDACNNQNCAAIWVPETPVPPEFVYYWLWHRYEITRGRGAGNSQPALNKARVQQLPFPLPPLLEQQEIVRRVEALFAWANAVEQRVAAARGRVEKLTQAVLAKAFRGELVPTEAELARGVGREYEPASVLLERIRAEREARDGRHRRNVEQMRLPTIG